MRAVFRAFGWVFTAAAVGFVLLGLASLPTGGPMFALPYVFFYAAVLFGAIGGVLLLATRRRAGREHRP